MKKLIFKKIDAFATERSAGNPAGVICLEEENELAPLEMQQIAAELKGFVSEVGYVHQRNEDTLELTYYSSEREVAFCGHATIAIVYDFLKNDARLLEKPTINIVTGKGRLLVWNKIPDEDAVFIFSPPPVFSGHSLTNVQIAQALDIEVQEMDGNFPVEVVNAGLETLIFPIRTLQGILAVRPDFMKLKQFCEDHAIDIVTVFSTEVSDESNRFRTRVFAPRFGYLEDPATGSGNAAFGHYLLKHRKWNGEVIAIEQNDKMNRANIIKLLTRRDDQNNIEVAFGGSAVLRIKGDYFLG